MKAAEQFTGIVQRVIQPHQEIIEGDRQLQASLLSGFLLAVILLGLISAIIQLITIPNFEQTFIGILIGILVLLIAYGFSRTRNFELGVLIVLVVPPIVVYNSITANPEDDISVFFLLIGVMVASIFLRERWFALVSAGYLAFILPIPALPIGDEIRPLFAHISAYLIVTAMVWITKRHRNAVEMIRLGEINAAYDDTLRAWVRALETRDLETEGHSTRVTHLTVRLAEVCGIKGRKLTDIYRGALLHDIGKMAISDEILLKPGKLTEAEMQVIKLHPQIAKDMLEPIHFLNSAIEIPLYHHERWNGSGYPFGLAGNEIPFSARLFSLVDVWDALRSDRPYRKAWSAAEAENYIRENSGILFDPDLVLLLFEHVNRPDHRTRKSRTGKRSA